MMKDKQGRRELADHDARLDELECARLINEGAITAQAEMLADLENRIKVLEQPDPPPPPTVTATIPGTGKLLRAPAGYGQLAGLRVGAVVIALVRHALARWLWDRATDLYGPHPAWDDDPEAGEWSMEFTIWATAEEADEVFTRCSDAVCGTGHHILDPCPGPRFVGGLHRKDDE